MALRPGFQTTKEVLMKGLEYFQSENALKPGSRRMDLPLHTAFLINFHEKIMKKNIESYE
jgi:hypothetical protein